VWNRTEAANAIVARWNDYRATTGETIKEGAERLGLALRTAYRYKAKGKLVLEDRLWVLKGPISSLLPIYDQEEFEDAARRIGIDLRTAYHLKEGNRLVLHDGVWRLT
jgi:hypothetical protein